MSEDKYRIIANHLSPDRPIRSSENLRGRAVSLQEIERELLHFHSTLFIYGLRGVGKTSLARTAAQIVNTSVYEHLYVACAPGSRSLHILRDIGEELLKRLSILGIGSETKKKTEVNVSLKPGIKTSFEKKEASLPVFTDINTAVRILKDLDSLIPADKNTVVVIDELEELEEEDREDIAYLIKQIGDQEFITKFVLVGIAGDVHELIGAHASVPRYIKEVSLSTLHPQDLMDIVSTACKALSVKVDENTLYRIAIIGNGFPHFSHLMGKAILIESILNNSNEITAEIYRNGVSRAVSDSQEELKSAYEAATQRSQDYFKHLVWSLAHSDTVDIRIDDWIELFAEISPKYNWEKTEDKKLRKAISNFASQSHGEIIVNTPARYGETKIRYRYKRFNNTLMRGHVRLQAELEGIQLGLNQELG